MHAVSARGIRLALQTFSVLLVVIPVFGQKGANPGTAPAASTGTGTNTGRGTLTSPNASTTNNRGTFDNQPVFISGQVIFADGSPMNPNIRVERVCPTGGTRLLAHTDSKGYFSVQLGQPDTSEPDASDSSPGMRQLGPSPMSTSTGYRRFGGTDNCEIRASYPGYRSDSANLGLDHFLGSSERIRLTLHPLTNVHGTTISVTTALAPKSAQKAYDKGQQLASKGKLEQAEERLSEATTDYPRYALAWFALGQVQQREGHAAEAQKSYQAAIAADSRYVSPYDQMALLSAQAGKWEDAAGYSKKAVDLNPVEFPSSFWYNALANYNLKRLGDAENSARQLLKIDSSARFVESHKLLARILLEKNDVAGAAEQMRTYLALAPNAKDAEALKQDLAKLDKATPAPAK